MVKTRSFFLLLLLCSFHKIAAQNSLIISEIMADPTPNRGLPESEYLEIYNPTDSSIFLAGYTLTYGTTVAQFDADTILPKSYAIVVKKENKTLWNAYQKVIGLSRLSLLNTGTTLELKNTQKQTVFSVTYSDKWYTSERNEGYALELIDLNFPCVEASNWTSSVAEKGGSPATENSVSRANPDVSPPEIEFYELIAEDTLSIQFSEKITAITILSENISIDNNLTINNIELIHPQNTVLKIAFSEPLPERQLTEIKLNNIRDCSGNEAVELSITLGEITPADSGEVVISEVLFDPKIGGEDFIELYNRSTDVKSLKNWSFATLDADGKLTKGRIISPKNRLIEGNQYLAFSENIAFLKENYLRSPTENLVEIESLPSYPNTKGTVILLNQNNEIFDRFDYSDAQHHPTIDVKDGVSLEKIDINQPSSNPKNWHSASAEHNFATPGYQNSQILEEKDDELVVIPEIFTPDGDGQNETTSLTYQFEKSGNVATIWVYDSLGRLVKKLTENQLLGTSGEISWDGKDNSGTQMSVGYYLFLAQILHPDGTRKTYRKKVVLGSKL
jgi:Lamin Tail Domain/CHU_C Type IX secretion signal domain